MHPRSSFLSTTTLSFPLSTSSASSFSSFAPPLPLPVERRDSWRRSGGGRWRSGSRPGWWLTRRPAQAWRGGCGADGGRGGRPGGGGRRMRGEVARQRGGGGGNRRILRRRWQQRRWRLAWAMWRSVRWWLLEFSTAFSSSMSILLSSLLLIFGWGWCDMGWDGGGGEGGEVAAHMAYSGGGGRRDAWRAAGWRKTRWRPVAFLSFFFPYAS